MQERWSTLSMVLVTTMVGAAGCVADDEPAAPDLRNADVTHYRISAPDLPASGGEVRANGFDLDGDLVIDNQLGAIHSAVTNVDSDFDVEGASRARLADDVAWMLSIYGAGTRGTGAAIDSGILVDGVALPDLSVEPAIGASRGAVLTGERARVPLGMLSDPRRLDPDPGFVDVLNPRIQIEQLEGDRVQVLFGGAIPFVEIDRIVLPRLAAFYSAQLADGRSNFARDSLDANGDGVITLDEVRDNNLMKFLLAPDLELEGTQALSLGVRLVATP